MANYKESTKQESPITKIKQKVEDKVVEDHIKALSSRVPGKLKLFAGMKEEKKERKKNNI